MGVNVSKDFSIQSIKYGVEFFYKPLIAKRERTYLLHLILLTEDVLIINKPFKVGPFFAGFPGTDPSSFSYQSVREKPDI